MIQFTVENHRLMLSDGNAIPVIGLGTYARIPRRYFITQPHVGFNENSAAKQPKAESTKDPRFNPELQIFLFTAINRPAPEFGKAGCKVKTNVIQHFLETPKGTCAESVKTAIDVGYRHIDGAFVYHNEDEVGQAIREKIAEGKIKREDIFYCGKLWNTCHPPEMVRPTLEKTLKILQLDYVDLYLIELPMAFQPGENLYPVDESGKWLYHETDLCATWEALEACKDAGLVKSLGVSNFNRRQLEMILNKPGLKYKPVTNQIECHPYFTQPKLLEFCKLHDIVPVGYSPLGTSRDESWVNVSSPPLLDDPLLNAIGEKYNKTAAQIALRFSIQRGVVVIPKSFNPKRIRENFQIFDFSLTDKEMKDIEALNKNVRYVELLMWKDHPEYPFHDEY